MTALIDHVLVQHFDMTHTECVEWTKALRSGEFKQGGACLVTLWDVEPRYCCLGVFCKINPARFIQDADVFVDRRSNMDSVTTVPGAFMNTVQIDIQFNTGTCMYMHATELNDALGLTFPQIADVIEYFVLPTLKE